MTALTDLVMVKGVYDEAGGPETVLQMIASHLDRQQFAPLLALLSRPGQTVPPTLAEVAMSLPTERLNWRGIGMAPASAFGLSGLLSARPGAILHTNDMRSDLLAYLVTRVRRIPWIAHVHGWLGETHAGRHKFYENIDRWLIRSADLVLVGSNAMADECRKAGAKKVEIVTNGVPAVEPALYDEGAARIRQQFAPGGQLIVGILGRLHPGKGHALLIQALADLRGRGTNFAVLFVGVGPAEADYRAEAARLGVSDAVHFSGLVPDPLPYLRAMDIVCVPSLKDSLPLTALEAMSVARPVIASRAGDLPLAIEDGETGLLVDIGSSVSLSAAIERLAADPDLRRKIGEAGRASLIANFTPQAMLRQLEAYCHQLKMSGPAHGQ